MKKLLFTLMLLLLSTVAMAFRGSLFINGYWGQWEDLSWHFAISGYSNNFVLHERGEHPSNYFVHVAINNFVPPTKDEKKYHIKNNLWYEYTGTVEYFVDEASPTIESLLKSGWIAWSITSANEISHHVKRTASATIKIAPYKDNPQTYNVFFDNVGFAISF